MSFVFYPAGVLVSSSRALTASFAMTSSFGGFPKTASFATFSSSSVGPTGSAYIIISGSDVTVIDV